MSQKFDNAKPSSERLVKDIRRAARRYLSAEEKLSNWRRQNRLEPASILRAELLCRGTPGRRLAHAAPQQGNERSAKPFRPDIGFCSGDPHRRRWRCLDARQWDAQRRHTQTRRLGHQDRQTAPRHLSARSDHPQGRLRQRLYGGQPAQPDIHRRSGGRRQCGVHRCGHRDRRGPPRAGGASKRRSGKGRSRTRLRPVAPEAARQLIGVDRPTPCVSACLVFGPL